MWSHPFLLGKEGKKVREKGQKEVRVDQGGEEEGERGSRDR
jgi:hypothetical protein